MSEETYEILRLGHHGDGIAEGPIFAPRTLPGEVVAGDVVEQRIDKPRILEPSANRIKVDCVHYNSCGGCSLLHASDAFVREWKADVVRAALAARDIEAEIAEVDTSPAASRRRAVFSGRKGKKGPLVGFHGRGSNLISEVDQCRVISGDIKSALPLMKEIIRFGGSRKSELSITVTQSDGGKDVSIAGGSALDRELETGLASLLHEHGLARISWNNEVVATETSPVQSFGSAKVIPPPGAFLQATKEGEQALGKFVLEASRGFSKAVDLFAGCGTFALPLARNLEVHAVEGSREMMDALDAGWRAAQGLKGVTTETRDLFRAPLLPDELDRFDFAVIDPPRAGALAQINELAASNISNVVMVSCNPVTFARDARILIDAGFEIGPVQVVDQFRWSTHVEQVAMFVR